ncbi:hypothetical protein SAMN05216421_1721 [Halopseudomonas xinjiangensis]|uniref:Lipoprotein n=1 Tax=Halopseudomonas xinjiangensis TaxID=487184 RepID=A0A1H1T2X9_9GAMM|nr:hypothetical protein [Halopseudomonas xinjiangensis]SDS54508.1 hypothetical protein SAMN05216421_1721 [Halopseudomonas xinjiangensis]
MKNMPRYSSLLGLALAALVLTGCEAAEESAQNLLDKTMERTTEAARKIADEAVGDAVDQFNEELDGMQEHVKETLGKPAEHDEATEQAKDESATEEKNRG